MKTQDKSEVKPEEQIRKIKKYNMFSQSETSLLTGFTRGQLVKWDKSKIIQPYRHPCILYDWTQIIILRILRYWRERASYQKIEGILSQEVILNDFFDKVPEASYAFLKDELIFFGSESFFKDNFVGFKILKGLEELKVESLDYYELMPGLIVLNIQSIISNLKKEGELLKIENFDLKVG